MLKPFAIAALAAALLVSGAYAPQAHVKPTSALNLTVVVKNQSWPRAVKTIDICDLSYCQDV
jgi:hypothetical protein